MLAKFSFIKDTNSVILKFPESFSDPSLFSVLENEFNFSELSDNTWSIALENTPKTKLYSTLLRLEEFLVNERIRLKFDDYAKKLFGNAREEAEEKNATRKKAKELLKKKGVASEELNSLKFKRDLKPYQKEPSKFMSGVRWAANFSVPGSGKTTTVYAAFSRLQDLGDVQKLLVIGPNAAYLAWSEEYEKCFFKKANLIRIRGDRKARRRIYERAEKHEIFITTYQTAARDLEYLANLLKNSKFLLVLDESHNIKRFEGGVWASAIRKLSDYAHRKIILTGTPVPNGLLDLWSQFNFLDPSILGSQSHFKLLLKKPNAEEIIRELISPYFRRIKKADLDLPRPIYRVIKIKPKILQSKIYEAIKKATLEEWKLEGQERLLLKDLRRALIIRLMQASSNPSLLMEKSEEFNVPAITRDKIIEIDPSIAKIIRDYSKLEFPNKLEAAEKLVRSLIARGRRKILIWSVWVNNINILERSLKDLDPVKIYGDVPVNEEEDPFYNREANIKKFKTDPKCRVMIANPGACGESISLHDVCHDAIYVDRTFNGGQFMQSLDRIHRVGLKKTDKINYYVLITKNTIDEVINRRLDEKKEKMLKLLNDDFKVINLETDLSDVSGISGDEENDFAAVVRDLRQNK